MANSFVKILTDSDVKKQMAVESNFVQHLPRYGGGSTVYFPVTDEESGKVWEGFGYYIRDPGAPKPVFQGDWHNFRRKKGLRAGDRITFNAPGNGYFSILAERKITLMGREVWSKNF